MKLNEIIYLRRESDTRYYEIVEECRVLFDPRKIRWFPYGQLNKHDIFHFKDKEDASMFVLKFGGTTRYPAV